MARHSHLLCIALLAWAQSASAGGYLVVSGAGVPAAWSGTISLNRDLGGLGSLTNTAADTLLSDGLTAWTSADTTVSFSFGADLGVDHAGTTHPALDDLSPDGISPIVYDTDGTVTEDYLGLGASQVVLGSAGPKFFSGDTIVEGLAVLNGLFINGTSGAGDPADVAASTFQGVITHEIGHMLNLDHAQFNEYFRKVYSTAPIPGDPPSFPTMFPSVFAGIETVEFDDTRWLANLYPSAGYTAGTFDITGNVYDGGGGLLNGVNIIGRRADDPSKMVAVSCVTGFLDGTPAATPDGAFRLPGLPIGSNWILTAEQIRPSFTGGSRVGPISPQIVPPGPLEYANEASVEGTGDALYTSTSFGSSTTADVTGVELRFSAAVPPVPIPELDSGRGFFTAQVIPVSPPFPLAISGMAAFTEPLGGHVDFFGDPIEDWYALPVGGHPGYKLTRVFLDTLTASDLDLYVVCYDAVAATLVISAAGLATGLGVDEELFPMMDSSFAGTGGGAGVIYLGVSHVTGAGPGGAYILTVEATVSEDKMLAVNAISGTAPGTLTITGRGFSSAGAGPTVAFSDPNLVAGTVTFIDSTMITVSTSVGGAVTPPVTAVVTNDGAAGSYAGRLSFTPTITNFPDWQLLTD